MRTDFLQQTKIATPIFEETCLKLKGIARCGKWDANRQTKINSYFSIRRTPHFIVLYVDPITKETHINSIPWRNERQTNTPYLIKQVLLSFFFFFTFFSFLFSFFF